MLNVREEGGNQQKYRHSRTEKQSTPDIFLPAVGRRIQDGGRHIEEPEKIGDDKQFTERNIIVHKNMDDLITPHMPFLKPLKPKQIYDEIQYKWKQFLESDAFSHDADTPFQNKSNPPAGVDQA